MKYGEARRMADQLSVEQARRPSLIPHIMIRAKDFPKLSTPNGPDKFVVELHLDGVDVRIHDPSGLGTLRKLVSDLRTLPKEKP